MLRKLLSLWIVCGLGLFALPAGCSENEHKVTEKKETKTEGEVEDVSPGEMIVE